MRKQKQFKPPPPPEGGTDYGEDKSEEAPPILPQGEGKVED